MVTSAGSLMITSFQLSVDLSWSKFYPKLGEGLRDVELQRGNGKTEPARQHRLGVSNLVNMAKK